MLLLCIARACPLMLCGCRSLACACNIQGNFEFGISRVMKALEPYPKKLGTDTWFYAKRAFLALADVSHARCGSNLSTRQQGGSNP